MIEVYLATPDYSQAIKQVKDAVWPHDSTSEAYIRQVIAQPDHQTFIAYADSVPAGLVDGFLTLSAQGVRRWEVDLLAVRPDFRKQGIASRLIQASVEIGQKMGAEWIRALIQVDNVGSQQAFSRCGFQRGDLHTLYISTHAPPVGMRPPTPEGLHLIPVNTLNYQGVWLEGNLGSTAFRLAQIVRAHYGWDVAGAVIPRGAPEAIAAAVECSYSAVGHYDWWLLS